MDLLTPGSGLIFWQLLIFAILLFVLAKFAFKKLKRVFLAVRREAPSFFLAEKQIVFSNFARSAGFFRIFLK